MSQQAKRRPALFVLAGVNGAGKSSIGGGSLLEAGDNWYNPDTFARELVTKYGRTLEEANGEAWTYGREKLEEAIDEGTGFAFETTLGANTIPQLIKQASSTHDVTIWFCGLSSPEKHIERVNARVAHGGHAIPEKKIRERWLSSIENLINLMPYLAHLQVYDNSADAASGQPLPTPMLILEMHQGRTIHPDMNSAEALAKTPDWAKAIVQAAIELDEINRGLGAVGS